MVTDNDVQEMEPELDELAFGGKHWTDLDFFSPSIMVDALIKHLIGLMPYGVSDLGEILNVVAKLRGGNEKIWFNSWCDLGQRLQERAEAAEKKGYLASAASGYLRASTYWRAGMFYYSNPEDPRMLEATQASLKCYQRYIELSGHPGEYVEFPYEDSFLPGYFYRSPVAKEKAPLLVFTPGRDTFAEDTRWLYEVALRRGYHCLVYDGPGQGFALRLNGHLFRTDWENVLSPMIDHLLEKFPGIIDESRMGLVGIGFGGYLSPRVAAFDKRFKVCVVNPGCISWGQAIGGRLAPLAEIPLDVLPEMVRNLVKDHAWKHGVPNTVKDVVEVLKDYDNSAILDQVTCDMLVLDGAKSVSGGSKEFYDAVNCPKQYMLFDETTGSQAHCQTGGYVRAAEDVFDWLGEHL